VKRVELVTCRSAYGKELAELGATHPEIVVLDADISKSTCTYHFARVYPERAFNFGVAEQNMMAAAAGLAAVGKLPFVSTYAVFATMRACEQIRTFIAYPRMNVRIVATHGGVAVGWDGVTHQGTEDIGMMRTIPGMAVVAPADAVSTRAAIRGCVSYDGPMYIRLGRNPAPVIYGDEFSFVFGRAYKVADGTDLTIIGSGSQLPECIAARAALAEEGISARLLDMHTIKPLDEDAVVAAAEETGALVTSEDHNIHGGLGSAVAAVLARRCPAPMEAVALADTFGESGDPKLLLEKYGLSAAHIKAAALRALARKVG